MRVLLAFDKFKDAIGAPTACTLAADTLRALHPDWQLDLCPLTDGGEGFAEVLTRHAGGELLSATVTGPLGQPLAATQGRIRLDRLPAAARAQIQVPDTAPPDATVAVIEMAAASGLAHVPPGRRDVWQATSRGTGELLRIAAETGAVALLLGVGGSATNDLGLGALAALGVTAHDAAGRAVDPPIPARWPEIARIRGAVAPGFPPLSVACDVANPLLGPEGCAAVYGRQKGLAPADQPRLEAESGRLARALCAHTGQPESLLLTPGAGAAGGIAFGLMAAARARLVPGFALVSAWLDLPRRIAAADLVLTGEGRFDGSSLGGKGPGALAALATARGRAVHVFAGAVDAPAPSGVELHAISPSHLPVSAAVSATPALLCAAIRTQFT